MCAIRDSMTLDRWLPLVFVACASTTRWGRAELATSSGEIRTVAITASRTAFMPDRIEVTVGEFVRLRFVRTTASSCAREVVVSLDGDRQIRRQLPVDVPAEITLRFDRAGELGFSCGMTMLGGTIAVRPGS